MDWAGSGASAASRNQSQGSRSRGCRTEAWPKAWPKAWATAAYSASAGTAATAGRRRMASGGAVPLETEPLKAPGSC